MLGRADVRASFSTQDPPRRSGPPTPFDERVLRRAVGPTAWSVLADLRLDARLDDEGVPVVEARARRIAANVGVGKDAAARALRRLIDAAWCAAGRSGAMTPAATGAAPMSFTWMTASSRVPLSRILLAPQVRRRPTRPRFGPLGQSCRSSSLAHGRRAVGSPAVELEDQLCLLALTTDHDDGNDEVRS